MTKLCLESVRRFEESELWFARQGGAVERAGLDVGQQVILRLPCGAQEEFAIRSIDLETYASDFALAVDRLAQAARSSSAPPPTRGSRGPKNRSHRPT